MSPPATERFVLVPLTSRHGTVLGMEEMEDTPDTPTTAFDDEVLLELAAELHRLAAGLKRDLQRNAVLPGLSDLTAMRPLRYGSA